MEKRIKVSVVEDNASLRDEWKDLLEDSKEFEFLEAYATAEAALKRIPERIPDAVLMDITLPGMSGVECVRRLRSTLGELIVIMITVHEDSEQVFEALKAGACGYLVKRTPPGKILEAISDAVRGGSPMSSNIARLVVGTFQEKVPPGVVVDNLTPREQEILVLLAKGLRYKEIGETLFISTETVRGHLRHVYEKLQVRSRTEAVVKFLGK